MCFFSFVPTCLEGSTGMDKHVWSQPARFWALDWPWDLRENEEQPRAEDRHTKHKRLLQHCQAGQRVSTARLPQSQEHDP